MKENKKNLEPDFIGIGAMKAATSWIFKCLVEHPEICGSTKKELHFFDRPDNYKRGIEYYKSFFYNCSHDKVKGEFTPSYIFSKEAPDLIHKHFPNVKLIACLRNPVDRAVSHYKFNFYKKGRLSIYKNFREAIEKDREIVERGNYYNQLKRYFDLFPKENILIIIYEKLKNNPEKEIKKIFKFLGVGEDFIPESLMKKENVSGSVVVEDKNKFLSKLLYIGRRVVSREGRCEKFLQKYGVYDFFKNVLNKNKIKSENSGSDILIKEEDRKYLRNIYKEEIENLEDLIKRDLNHWK